MKEMNEHKKQIMEGIKWRVLKKEFDELNTYPEKLAWWKINVPSRNSKVNIMPIFQYSGAGAPQVNNIVCAIIVHQNDNTFTDTAITERAEFISILPKLFDNNEQQQFWEWLSVKINIAPIEHFENDYKEQLENILPLNRNEIIEKLKNKIELEKNKYKNHFDFQNGRNYSVNNHHPKYLKFGNPDIYFMGIEGSINKTIQGYHNNQKEIALENVINNLNTENIEPIEDLPTETKKIKWLGTPSQFSYIFLELVNKGFIEQPMYRSETSPSRFAEQCFDNFEIQTTLENLKTEFKKDSSLGDTNRSKFTIPERLDVTDKRSGNKKTVK